MMAAISEKNIKGWLWAPLGDDHTHPAETPKEEVAAAKRWDANLRGPRLARIGPVSVLIEKKATKPNHVYVLDNDILREVPKHMVLHEREGFLIIQELLRMEHEEEHLHADWIDEELRTSLEKHSQGKVLPSAQYVHKILIKKAVTGVRYLDENRREISYRRDIVEKPDEDLPVGEDKDGYFRIKDVIEYMPPWEALCHGKCGFYQDFYKVRWEEPYSEVDYGQVENGCSDEIGATWEPDENLPPCLDYMRIKAKKAWCALQIEREAKVKRAQEQPADVKRLRGSPREEEEKKENKPMLAQLRRNQDPLESDIFVFGSGHDLVPESSDRFPDIRTGWPMHSKDYPPGFGVAQPPGFCWDGCDCMDDQRSQMSWEVTKKYLEDLDKSRTPNARAAVEGFQKETSFVRLRGSVSRMFYFEPLAPQTEMVIKPSQSMASNLALTVQGALRQACFIIPVREIFETADPLYLPARALISIKDNMDYLPICIEGQLENGSKLPPWLKIEPASGRITISRDNSLSMDIRFNLLLKFYEGSVKTVPCTVAVGNSPTDLATIIRPIISQLSGSRCADLDDTIKSLVRDNLAELYDAPRQAMRPCSLGKFVQILTRCQNMLRAHAVANLTPQAPKNGSRPGDPKAKWHAQPVTPQD